MRLLIATLSSRKAAVAGLLGAGVGGAVAAATGFSSTSIASGLLGYNAALCAIALKDRPAYAALASVVTDASVCWIWVYERSCAYCAVRHCNLPLPLHLYLYFSQRPRGKNQRPV